MITGWLLKIVISIAVIGLIAVEGGSPLITRAQVDGAAHNIADDATAEYFQTRDEANAREVADEIAADEEVSIEEFGVDPESGVVTVKVFKEARSVLLKKWSTTRSWYEIRVTATGETPGK